MQRPFLSLALATYLWSASALAQDTSRVSSDWSTLKSAVWARVVISTPGKPDVTARIHLVDDSSMTIDDLDRPGDVKFMVLRDDVSEVKRWSGRRWSITRVAIGTLAGFAVGFVPAKIISNNNQNCGRSCLDENMLIYGALFGPATYGAYYGYKTSTDSRRLTTIYKRP